MKEFKFIRELFCAHKRRMFIGSSVGTVSGKKTYYYACENCCKAFSDTKEPVGLRVITGHSISGKGIFFSSFDKKYNVKEFIEKLKEGKLLFSREDLEEVLNHCYAVIKNFENSAEYYSQLASVKESEVVLLKSILENTNNLIPDPELELTDEERSYVRVASDFKDYTLHLLRGEKVDVPVEIYKPFQLFLSTLMGYEKLRYWYKWEDSVNANGEAVKTFYKRKKRD